MIVQSVRHDFELLHTGFAVGRVDIERLQDVEEEGEEEEGVEWGRSWWWRGGFYSFKALLYVKKSPLHAKKNPAVCQQEPCFMSTRTLLYVEKCRVAC